MGKAEQSRPPLIRRYEVVYVSAGLFTLALVLRIIFAVQWQNMPYGDTPLLDARAYDDWAQSITDGHLLRHQAFYQSPLYPYVLALFYKVFGHDLFGASLLNAVLDSFTAVTLSLVVRVQFGRMAQMITGVLAALYAPMIFYTAPVMKEPLALLLMSLFMLTSLHALTHNRPKAFILAGVMLGLAVLTRGNTLLLFPVVPIMAWVRYRRAAIKSVLFFAGALLLTLLPATVHNAIVSYDFVPVTYADGFNLYIGHSPYANGTNAYPPEVSTDPVQEELNQGLIASRQVGHSLTPSHISAYWRTKAVSYALDNPWREAQLLGLKLFAFWNDADGFDNYDVRFIRAQFPSVLNLPLFGFGVVSALAAFGFVASWRTKRMELTFLGTAIGVYMLSVVLFYVTDRYRLPVVVFLFPLAGAAIPMAVKMVRERNKKQLFATALCAAVFLSLAYAPPMNAADLTAFDWGTLVATYADKGNKDAALDAFEKGKAISETGIGVQAYIRAAEMHERAGEPDSAMVLVMRAVELFPQDGIARYNLARQDLLRGDIGAALVSLDDARRLTPSYTLTYYAFVKIYRQLGDKARAEKALREGLAISPHDARLLALVEEK